MKTCCFLSLQLAVAVAISFLLTGLRASAQSGDPKTTAEHLVDLLSKSDFSAAYGQFDGVMKTALPEAKLKEVWEALQGQVGPFKKRTQTRALKYGTLDVVLVTCEFEKTSLDAKIALNSQQQVSGLFFVPCQTAAESGGPAPYVNTNAFEELEVKIGKTPWVLPGTLTRPKDTAVPCPAVVLVHGSGPNDRDESVGANKPFKDLAWGLASRGIAVLRYEKRTKQHPAAVMAAEKLTLREETVDDALSAVELLRRTEGIDAKRIFVLGHSLGGLAAPRIGQADPAIAGLIILAGSTRPLEDLMVEQTRYLLSLDGQISKEGEAKLVELEAEVAKIKKLSATNAASRSMILGAPAQYWLDLRGYDPAATARRLKQPMLILQGGRDYQVTEADFDGWKHVLGSRANVTLKLYPNLNHLFMAGEGKSKPSEYDQPGHVDQTVVEDIARWILRY